ncbi:MAG: glycosyltransferase family 2 protein [Candidatus Hodarchaeota archaeon]
MEKNETPNISKQNSRICLITNAWNEAHQLANLFFTVINQKLTPSIWLFIDDGSVDTTPTELVHLMKKYPNLNVKVIKMPKKTKGNLDTIGIALKKALLTLSESYDYYAKLDADSRMPQSYFEEMVKKFEKDPKLMVASGTIVANGFLEPTQRKIPRGSGMVIRGNFFEKFIADIPEITIDTWIYTKAQIYGFKTWQFDDLLLLQTRPTTQLTTRGSFRNGKLYFYFSHNFVFVIAKAIKLAILERKGSAFLHGYWYGKRKNWKINDKQIRDYYRKKAIVDLFLRLASRFRRSFSL